MTTATMTIKPRSGDLRTQALAQLSDEDRALYESIPAEIDYQPHPSYRLIGTENKLFGPEAASISVPQWRQYPELDDEEDIRLPKARPQLNGQQEHLLFMRYNYARYRLARLVQAQNRRFAASRVKPMLEWYKRGLETRAIITSANMALVVAMAKRTRINAVEFGELVSEGNMALLRAVEKFDVARGFKFSTYACRAILKSFNRLATRTGSYKQHFPTEFDPEMERSDEYDRRHRDQHDLAVEDLQRVLIRNLAELSEVEQAVVSARFAVAGQPEVETLEEVGRRVGLSKERVLQVQNDALAKLRAAMDLQSTGPVER